MFHTMGVRKMLASTLVNGKLVCMPDYSPEGVLRQVAAERVSSQRSTSSPISGWGTGSDEIVSSALAMAAPRLEARASARSNSAAKSGRWRARAKSATWPRRRLRACWADGYHRLAGMAPSSSSRCCLRFRPPAYPVSLPVDPTTRWQGIRIDSGLAPTKPPAS